MRNIIRKGLLSVLCVSAVLYTTVVFASPAKPALFEHTQPDGSVIYARMWGDEFYNFIGDEDGYLLREAEDGGLYYVTEGEADDLVVASPSKSGRPADAVKGFDLRDDAPSFYVEDDVIEEEEEEAPVFYASSSDGTIREQKLLIIVPDYNDWQLQDMWTKELFHNSNFSQEDGVYSLANYYKEVSGDRVTFVPAFRMSEVGSTADGATAIIDDDITDIYGAYTDGVIRVKLDKEHLNTAGSTSQGVSNKEAQKILAEADKYIDFSVFSGGKTTMANSDVSILFFMPGYNRSGSDNKPGIWAHKTWFASTYSTSHDGVRLCTSSSGYVMTGALDVNSKGDTIPDTLGTRAHELGHLAFGLPDLYATDNGTDNSGLKTLSLMNIGCWGTGNSSKYPDGTHPSHLDAWCKYYLGWYDESKFLEVDSDHVGEYDLVNWLSDEDGYNIIKINSTKDDEYYLLENRQFNGFDIGIRHSYDTGGIVAYRIDEGLTTDAYVNANVINNGSDPGVAVMHSGKGLSNFYNSKRPGWYKANNRMTSFGKGTFPNNSLNSLNIYTDPIDEEEIILAEDSGVGFSVLSSNGNAMKVRVGMNDVDTEVYSSSGNTKMYVFNNTDGTISTVPFLAEYSGSSMSNLLKYPRVTIGGKGYKATEDGALTVDTGKYKYKNFTLDFPKFTPYYTDYVPPVPQEKVYRLAVDTKNVNRDGAYDGMRVKSGSYVLFNVLNGYTYLNNGYMAESTTSPAKLVALKVGKGDNKFTAVNGNETLDGDTVIGISTNGTKRDVSYTGYTDVTSSSGLADTDHPAIYNTATNYAEVMNASAGFTTDGSDYIKFSADVYYTLTSDKINGSTGYSAIFGVQNGNTKKYISVFNNGDVGIGASGTYNKTGVKLNKNAWNRIEICADSTGKSLDVYLNNVLAIKGYTGAGSVTKGFNVITGITNSNVYYSNLHYVLHVPGEEDVEDTGMGFEFNTNGGLANMTSGENAVVGSKVEFLMPRIAAGNTVKYFNNGTDVTSSVTRDNGIVLVTIDNKGDNKIKAVEYNGNEVVRESEEVNIIGEVLTGGGKNDGTDTVWPVETKYAAYLEEGAEATEEEIAVAGKLWGVVDGTTTRKPAQGTGTATSSYRVNLETSDYLYLRTNIFINGELAYDYPWFSRWENNYIRIKNSNNHILLNTSTDTKVTVQANEWQKIEIYADGSNMDIYINGVLKGKKCAPLSMTSVRMWLGSTASDTEPNLYIDRLDYWRGARKIEQ